MENQMTLNEYQEKAMSTCMPSCDNISYMLLNLVGEVGEFASKLAKDIRKENIRIENNELIFTTKITLTEGLKGWKSIRKKLVICYGNCLVCLRLWDGKQMM